MLTAARVVTGVIVGTVVGLVMYASGAWLVVWLVWGAAVGLLVARWWALFLAGLVLPVGYAVNLISTRGQVDEYSWFTDVLGVFVPLVTAFAGIVLGIAAVKTGGYLRRRLAWG